MPYGEEAGHSLPSRQLTLPTLVRCGHESLAPSPPCIRAPQNVAAGSMPPAPVIRPRHPGGGAAGVPWPEPEHPALRSNENKGLTGAGGAVILREDEKTHVGAVVLRGC